MVVPATDAAYLAGLIDGEGSISLVKGQTRIHPRLEIYNTNRDVLDWVASVFGGTVCSVGRAHLSHKPEYVWHCGPQHAQTVLEVCRPYLKIKGRQADIFTEFHATKTPYGYDTSPDVKANRLALVASMRVLNKKGVAR